MLGSQRIFTGAVRRFCAARGVALTALSQDWLLIMERGGRSHRAFAYDLGLNDAATHRIVNDKAASFDVLAHFGVDAVEHRLIVHPRLRAYAPAGGAFAALAAALAEFGGDAVVKAVDGAGGEAVLRVRDVGELERAALALFAGGGNVCLSPFTPIGREVRVYLADGAALYAYAKTAPAVVGDGAAPALALAAAQIGPARLAEIVEKSPESLGAVDFLAIPAAGERVALSWKHNLGQGAGAELAEDWAAAFAAEIALAARAAAALGLRFGTVDVAATPEGPRVMEANTGVMMEWLAAAHPEGAALADRIYGAALEIVLRERLGG